MCTTKLYSQSHQTSFFALMATPREAVGWWWGRPQNNMTQTSMTKSVAISLLKHTNGNPFGTTVTLVDLWLRF